MLLTKTSRTVEAQETEKIRRWLIKFAAAVRRIDYDRGRTMFSQEVVSFGSINEMLDGLNELEIHRWRNVWGMTRGFDFDYDSLRCDVSGDSAWAIALWSSQGISSDSWYDRQGRCTFIFERTGERWLAVHSHFSMAPKQPPGRV